MSQIRVVYTKRAYNPVSIAIRCAVPVSIVKMAPASHCVVYDGDTGYVLEANMLHGVRRVPLADALHGLTVVSDITYQVEDAEAGLVWGRETAERDAPYDWRGALGLGLAPGRNWQEDSDWFCSEYAAMMLAKAGRDTFANNALVTPYMLMCLNPNNCVLAVPSVA